ncbi:ISAs1 family transposase [Nonomuraea sp. NPDC046570]|uniref:ISAs1 family transposase n=1 Tax=Nonomuraea sp. NPDC046570 TaxID=3155255 RepID=UPI0033E73BE4
MPPYAAHRAGQLHDFYDDPDELIPMTVEGKTSRGSATTGRSARHRLGVLLAEDGGMVATCDVSAKSNEITAFASLLDQIGCLTNVVITADRLHCQREHTRYLHRRDAFYVFHVGGNQPKLFDQLDALAWKDVPIEWTTYDRGHGRTEIRTIQVLPAPPGIRFPRAREVFLLERYVYDPAWMLGVTSLPADLAGPRRLAELVRGEWSIENQDHYVRDATLGEDRCRIRTASAPSILATMRSYALGALRLLNHTNIAEGIRWARDDFRQSCRCELLDRCLLWKERHLRQALREYEEFYNQHRAHQVLAQGAPLRAVPDPITDLAGIVDLNVRRRDRLGGVLSRRERPNLNPRISFSSAP